MTAPNPFQPAHAIAQARLGIAAFEAGKSYTRVRAVIRSIATPDSVRGKYLAPERGDRSGRLEAKCWEGASLAETLKVGDVLEVSKVVVDEYKGKVGLKFEPRDLKVLAPGGYAPSEFVPTLLAEEIEHHWGALQEYLDSIENPHLQRLRQAVFADPEVAAKYKTHPSAVFHHHNYIGGNVEHVHGIMRVVDAVCRGYPELDRDLVLLGAAIHDLGKLREYAVDTMITVTDDGRLRGHLVIGAEWLGQIAADVRRAGYDLPRGIEDHLVHMILSHHRRGDWGSPKPPATPEAMLLHLADYADSQTKGFLQFVEQNRDSPEGWAKRWDSDLGDKVWARVRRDWE